MNIFVIGQCTLHWGRMEFGNIGNYYVIEPFFRELHRVFPKAKIRTTFQMSNEFQFSENVVSVPMDLFYGWNEHDLDNAYKEVAIASIYKETGTFITKTPFIEEVLKADFVINYSGDIWGQNADLVGKNRFLVGILKDKTVQLLGKKTAMIAGSPGPFNDDTTLSLAHAVYASYDYKSNREPESKSVLNRFGFDTSQVVDAACPAFIFEPGSQDSIKKHIVNTPLSNKKHPVVGFMLCGWNMLQGPFNREDWRNEEFEQYVYMLTKFIEQQNVDICFMSHSNGFELPPNFKPIRGRDFPLVHQLYELMLQTKYASNCFILDGVYNAKETKAIVANFDMLISGRVHGAIAGISQNIPTVIIDYGHKPKAHKLIGFAQVAGLEDYVANPADANDLLCKVLKCWDNKEVLRQHLKERNKYIAKLVHKQFDDLKLIVPLCKI